MAARLKPKTMEYTAVIRTLGRAGEKYQTLLDSLLAQTIRPAAIVVYIAEGYPLPAETVGVERYVRVRKGMMAQRALPYTEVRTEWMLLLDDDVWLSRDAVERMHGFLLRYRADVISPDVFHNAARPWTSELLMTLSGRMHARRHDPYWGYKVMRTAGYSYNKHPAEVMESQANAGPCLLCRKVQFAGIRLQDELWIDRLPYALGEDQIMFYKMYRRGLKVLTWYGGGVRHLDAGGNLSSGRKERRLLYCDLWFKTVFWHRFLFLPERSWLVRIWAAACLLYVYAFSAVASLLKGRWDVLKIKFGAVADAVRFIRSEAYQSLPRIV